MYIKHGILSLHFSVRDGMYFETGNFSAGKKEILPNPMLLVGTHFDKGSDPKMTIGAPDGGFEIR